MPRRIVLPGGGVVRPVGSERQTVASQPQHVQGDEGDETQEQPVQQVQQRGGFFRKVRNFVAPPPPPPMPESGPVVVGEEGEAYRGPVRVRRRRPLPPPPPQPVRQSHTGFGSAFSRFWRGNRNQQPAQPPQPVRRRAIGTPEGATHEVKQNGGNPPFIQYRNWPDMYHEYCAENYWVEGSPAKFLVRGPRPNSRFASYDDAERTHADVSGGG